MEETAGSPSGDRCGGLSYRWRLPDTLPRSKDAAQQDGNVLTGSNPVEFRAPYIDLQPGFFAGPGFLAVVDPNTCIEDCDVCCDGWGGFTVDTYGEGNHNVLNNVFTPNGDGVNDTWDVLDTDHPYCAYGAMAFDLHIYNQWGSTVWRLEQDWAEGCCPFESWSPSNDVVSCIYWDGTANAGVAYCHGCHVSNSVYLYVLTLTGCNGQVTYTGDITIFGSPAGLAPAPTPPLQDVLAPVVRDSLVVDRSSAPATSPAATGLDDHMGMAALHLWPNPATDRVWLEYAPGLAQVWLMDGTGRRVLEASSLGASTIILQIGGLAPASYVIVTVDAEGYVQMRKLVKQ